MNLPNKLTMGRIIAVPFFIFFYVMGWYLPALILFILASITDALDGHIARSRNMITNFGKIMDPLADKILVYSAFCLFVASGLLPAWMLAVVLAREFLIAGMRTVAASEGIVIAADWSGKIKTTLQMVAVPFMLLALCLRSEELTFAAYWVLVLSVVATVVSGVEYILKNRKVFSDK